MHVPKLAEAIADQWRGLKKFASDLAQQLPGLGPRGHRGVKQNIAILEAWIRAALLQLAAIVELPAKQAARRNAPVAARAGEADPETHPRRAGFRAIDPDDYDRQISALNGTGNRFDISAYDGPRGSLGRDQRPLYVRRLEAIEAVLEAPERYARRVRQRLEARSKRPPVTFVKLPQRAPVPEARPPQGRSGLFRVIEYNDSS